MGHERRQSLIQLLFNMVLEQTEQKQTNLPKMKHPQKMASETMKQKILFEKYLDTRWKTVNQVEINTYRSPN